ncbi:MAG: hypothetical protein JSU63_18275 [Phycisphaerales bacterium]|nr:MAG: hypothetical protein JSU63_18275 [Phycisphaerales bacterium]
MNGSQRERVTRRSVSLRICILGIVSATSTMPLIGCAARTLTITQEDFINTRVHINRAPEQRTGEPLEVNIVCVYPSDLDKLNDVNARLSPQRDITSDVWYAYRPEIGKVGVGARFDLPSSQIYLLTDEKEVYGQRVGGRLCGAKQDGKSEIKVAGIKFREAGRFKVAGSLFNERAVIYVFPKFIGPDGKVVPVAPAKFHPPGTYRRDLYVKIGVKGRGTSEDQYIERTSKPE